MIKRIFIVSVSMIVALLVLSYVYNNPIDDVLLSTEIVSVSGPKEKKGLYTASVGEHLVFKITRRLPWKSATHAKTKRTNGEAVRQVNIKPIKQSISNILLGSESLADAYITQDLKPVKLGWGYIDWQYTFTLRFLSQGSMLVKFDNLPETEYYITIKAIDLDGYEPKLAKPYKEASSNNLLSSIAVTIIGMFTLVAIIIYCLKGGFQAETPKQQALLKLKSLKDSSSSEFKSTISLILNRYLKQAYAIKVEQLDTAEVISELNGQWPDKSQLDLISEILIGVDDVKYSGNRIPLNEQNNLIDKLTDFIMNDDND
ncbi:MAG: hypothetical protein HRT89_04140 [Lentisphaeria bacterium]|nr:hypothetical protein [Lentisphaeria bacterium]NQZ67241.1 hypothetical protein [Lentisphaeria bacterium]